MPGPDDFDLLDRPQNPDHGGVGGEWEAGWWGGRTTGRVLAKTDLARPSLTNGGGDCRTSDHPRLSSFIFETQQQQPLLQQLVGGVIESVVAAPSFLPPSTGQQVVDMDIRGGGVDDTGACADVESCSEAESDWAGVEIDFCADEDSEFDSWSGVKSNRCVTTASVPRAFRGRNNGAPAVEEACRDQG